MPSVHPSARKFSQSYPWYRNAFEEEAGKVTFLADVATLPVLNLQRFLMADYYDAKGTGRLASF